MNHGLFMSSLLPQLQCIKYKILLYITKGYNLSILSLALLLGYEKLSHVQRICAYLSHNQSISPDRVFDTAGVKNLFQ